MPTLTKHAKTRMKERSGITQNNQQKMNSKIFKNGIRYEDTIGNLHDYINKINLKNEEYIETRVYGDSIYIFKKTTMITVLNIPESILTNLQSFIKPEAWAKYLISKNGDKRLFELNETLKKVILNYVNNNENIPNGEVIFRLNTPARRLKIFYKDTETFTGEERTKLHHYFSQNFNLTVSFEKDKELEPSEALRIRSKKIKEK